MTPGRTQMVVVFLCLLCYKAEPYSTRGPLSVYYSEARIWRMAMAGTWWCDRRNKATRTRSCFVLPFPMLSAVFSGRVESLNGKCNLGISHLSVESIQTLPTLKVGRFSSFIWSITLCLSGSFLLGKHIF